MKRFKKATVLFLCLCLISASFLGITVFSASASVTNPTANVGSSVSVRVNIRTQNPMYTAEVNVSFDNSKLQFASASGAKYSLSGNKISFIDDDLSGTSQVTTAAYTVTFTAIAEGSASVNVSGYGVLQDYSKDNFSASGIVTVKAASQPQQPVTPPATTTNDASLVALRVSGAVLSPAFSKNVTKYQASVKNDVSKVTVSATAVGGATFVGAGTFNLNVGDNQFTITSTAADGKTKKSYTVTVHRMTVEEEKTLNETQKDPLDITVNGEQKRIVADITSFGVYEGWLVEDFDLNGAPVKVLRDSAQNYTLFFITDTDGKGAYYNRTEKGDEEKITHLVANNRLYIVKDFSKNTVLPDKMVLSTLKLESGEYPALKYTEKDFDGFYVLSCYFDGKTSFYRFDSNENTFQRMPEFALGQKVTADKKTDDVVWLRFKNATPVGKILIILIIGSVIALAVLIVLIIVRIIRGKRKPKERIGATVEAEENLLDDVEILSYDE